LDLLPHNDEVIRGNAVVNEAVVAQLGIVAPEPLQLPLELLAHLALIHRDLVRARQVPFEQLNLPPQSGREGERAEEVGKGGEEGACQHKSVVGKSYNLEIIHGS
jgi:hypothetical protein